MSHSLEHFDIAEIPILLKDMAGVLSDDGLVVIEVPHVDLRREIVVRNRLNDAPHLSFFSPESLKRLVEHSPFELIFMNTVGQFMEISFSDENSALRAKAFANKAERGGSSFKKTVVRLSKKVLKHSGIYPLVQRSVAHFKQRGSFFDDLNFKYGGDRNLIRCVLRKRS